MGKKGKSVTSYIVKFSDEIDREAFSEGVVFDEKYVKDVKIVHGTDPSFIRSLELKVVDRHDFFEQEYGFSPEYVRWLDDAKFEFVTHNGVPFLTLVQKDGKQ